MRVGTIGSTATAGPDWAPGPVMTPTLLSKSVVKSELDVGEGIDIRGSSWYRPIRTGTPGAVSAATILKSLALKLPASEAVSALPDSTVYRSTKSLNGWREPRPTLKETGIDCPASSEDTPRLWTSPTAPPPLSALVSLLGCAGS